MTTQQQKEPLPCPFCASTDVGGAGGVVSCYRCNAKIEVQNTNTDYAVELWNRRAAQAQQVPEGCIPMPQNADEAQLMALTGESWLRTNAPDRLRETKHQVPEGWAIERVPGHDVFPNGIRVDSPDDHHCIVEKVGLRPHHPINLFYDLLDALLTTPNNEDN